MATLSALYCYPVKSCRGVSLAEATLDARGIAHDREFLVVDHEDRFLTQRGTPALALVETALTPSALVLRWPGIAELTVLWEIPAGAGEPQRRRVTVWRDSVLADDAGDDAADWLSDTLGQSCRLVRTGHASERPVPAGRLAAGFPLARMPAPQVAFPDGYPLLILSEESLGDLNGRIGGEPLPMDRFRPNLVVTGCQRPYEEDDWKTYRIGDATFWSAEACERCVVTTTDQRTLTRGKEPLKTLAGYRRLPHGGVFFGRNVLHESPGGRLRVGDPVRVIA